MDIDIHRRTGNLEKQHRLGVLPGEQPAFIGLAQGAQQELVLDRALIHIQKDPSRPGLGRFRLPHQAVHPRPVPACILDL